MTDAARLAAIREQYESANRMVGDLCQGHREWIMSIPARADYDPDLVIDKALRNIPWLLAALTRLSAENAALRKALLNMAEFAEGEGHGEGPDYVGDCAVCNAVKEARATLAACDGVGSEGEKVGDA